jgi:hypothetical protein
MLYYNFVPAKMKKQFTIWITLILFTCQGYSQADSFDVFRFILPELFTKTEMPSVVHLQMKNNDTSFCRITLYKCLVSTGDTMETMIRQWNEQVVKKVIKADEKPKQLVSGKSLDGWSLSLALGNFYENGKKGIVMLNSFKKGDMAASVVFTFNDRIFQPPIEEFTKNLHLINDQ